jgi:hypothetical protein
MAATGATPISLYYSATATNVPTAGNLVAGELAINTADGKLFYKDSSGVVQTIASKDINSGTFTNISVSGVASFADGTVSLPSITNIGDTNTGIFFPAADTIAFTEGGAESMRIDSSGNVGIGTTSPGAKLEVNGDALVSWAAASTKFIGSRFSTTYDLGMYMDADNRFLTLSAKAGDSTGTINFKTGVTPTERMRIDSSGNLLVGITSARANAGDVQVSKGISFPATQSAQSDANTLDDYEEGTFDPRLSFATGGDTFSYNARVGTYTKIGRLVTINVLVDTSAKGAGTGNLSLTNLPFTVASTTYAATVPRTVGISNTGPISAYTFGGQTTLIFFTVSSIGVETQITNTNVGAANTLIFSLTYVA